jgi:hypothetical protein
LESKCQLLLTEYDSNEDADADTHAVGYNPAVDDAESIEHTHSETHENRHAHADADLD